MDDGDELVRALGVDEVAALGPLPDPDRVSPTTDRHDRSPGSTAEVHSPGVLASPAYEEVEDDPFAPPPSLGQGD